MTDHGPSVLHGCVHCRLEVQLCILLREIARLAARLLPPTISIRTNVPAALWPVVGDAGEIHQALCSVLLNARTAMRQAGQLALSARNATLRVVPASPIFDARAGH